jgi:hypothetical protein
MIIDQNMYTETLCKVIFEKITKTRAVDKILTADIKKEPKKLSYSAIKFAATDKK